MTTNSQKKVLLGLSGGVDSAAAAFILKEQGYHVTGFFFDVTGAQKEAAADAKKAADQLGIQLICKDVSKEFSDIVINDFCRSYEEGKTPNPCVLCNPTIKFKQLLLTAGEIGADFIATGHYARIAEVEGTFYLRRAASEKKDQSYMLYRLGQDVLSRLLLPLGNMNSKEEVRDLVRGQNLENADKKDSQEICFIKDESYIDYLTRCGCKSKPGHFIDRDGKVLGQHQGLIHYTIGQRKGLGITFGKPVFITEINHKNNTVTLSDNEDLFTHAAYSENHIFSKVPTDKSYTAKVRYAAKPALCHIFALEDGRIKTVFLEPQRAITPGQSIVFYDEDIAIGGGVLSQNNAAPS